MFCSFPPICGPDGSLEIVLWERLKRFARSVSDAAPLTRAFGAPRFWRVVNFAGPPIWTPFDAAKPASSFFVKWEAQTVANVLRRIVDGILWRRGLLVRRLLSRPLLIRKKRCQTIARPRAT